MYYKHAIHLYICIIQNYHIIYKYKLFKYLYTKNIQNDEIDELKITEFIYFNLYSSQFFV